MGTYSMTLIVALVMAFVAPVPLLSGEAIPSLAVLSLENKLELKGEAVEQRDMTRHARRGLLGEAQGTNSGVVQFPVLGSIDVYAGWPFLTHVKVGNPAKDFTLLIDTGSATLWLSCSPCSYCPASSVTRESYDPSQSRTSSAFACSDDWCKASIQSGIASCDPSDNQYGRCSYDIVYGSGSTNGYYVSDEIHFDTVGGTISGFSSSIIFGCSNFQTGDLAYEGLAFDGILGIGPSQQSINSQLNSIGLAPMVFSLCLKSLGRGSLLLGEAVAPGFVYTTLVPGMYYYLVYLESITVNGKKLAVDPAVFSSHERQTFVDSGTSLTYLPAEAYDAFLTAIVAFVSLSPSVRLVVSNGQQCFITSRSLEVSFPIVTLYFTGGAEMILMPRNYLLPNSLFDPSMYCMGWKRQQGRPKTILGDIVLMDKLVVYDFENMRLGWMNYDCSQAVNLTTSNHWNRTSNHWNKRPANSGHTTRTIVIHTRVAMVVISILVFGGQYPFPKFI